jgi:hypothetical protein
MYTGEMRPTAHRGWSHLRCVVGLLTLRLLAACAPSGEPRDEEAPPPIEGGTVLAALELDAPTQSEFVVRGTVPVPPDIFPRPDGLLPLSIRASNGFVVPTRVSVVSRYAAAGDGADVVEVSGRVALPSGVTPGQKITYAVVYDPHPAVPVKLHSSVETILNTPDSVTLRAVDVFGHVYERDLFADLRSEDGQTLAEEVARGVSSARLRSYGVLLPDAGPIGSPSGALPHFFGVHAYVTAWAHAPGFNLSLRVHNGFDGYEDGLSEDDPLGVVYFRTLELLVPSAWVPMLDIVDVASGPSYAEGSRTVLPLVAPLPGGDMHMMPHLAQFQRRLGVSLAGVPELALHLAADEAQAFARPGKSPDGPQLWSWWNKDTARYWPQKQPLPDLGHVDPAAIASKFTGQYWMVRTALETGNPGDFQVPSGAMGWAHPWGVSYGGMTGGNEIYLYDGIELASARSNHAWKYTQTVQRMLNDRQPTAIYDRFGQPTELEKWVVHGASFDFIGFDFWQTLKNGNDPFGFNAAPQFQIQHVQSQGFEPPYQGALWGYSPIDFQHYVRYTRVPKVLAWLGNDWMAKDDLLQVAENFRLSHHEYPNSSGNPASGSGIFNHEQFVAQYPNHGFGFGRGEAWGLDAMCSAYGLGDTDYRNKTRKWFERVADTVANGQASCSGFIQAQVVSGWLNGQWRTRSGPEHAIVENALWGLKESVFAGADNARMAQTESVLEDAIYAMIGPMAWSPEFEGPFFAVAVSDKDLGLPPYCNNVPAGGAGMGPDHYQGWSSLAYGYQLTGDDEFLQKASLMGDNGDLLTWLQNQGTGNIVNQSALLALLQ